MTKAQYLPIDRRSCLMALPGFLVAPTAMAANTATARSMIRLQEKGQPSPPATLADMIWLEGHWIGRMPDGPVEHIKFAARAGQMPGFVRALNSGGIVFYEITVIAEVGGSLVQRLKHFTPQLEGWEARETFIERPLVAKTSNAFFFHGSTYERVGPDSYIVYHLNRNADGSEGETLVVPFHRKQAKP